MEVYNPKKIKRSSLYVDQIIKEQKTVLEKRDKKSFFLRLIEKIVGLFR